MSASLVGSEMCIRDSVIASCALAARPSRSSSLSTVPRGTRGTAGGARAVSYTHLTLPTICSV
eukprot:6666927-Alexandrium_andersonii.AAC.1